jgi:energy-coupling factor transporter transmembrane protein EcfT/uncharacterized membrane protein
VTGTQSIQSEKRPQVLQQPNADERINRIAHAALLSALALVLSYIESTIPLPIAIPGVKLGLGNIAVLVALYRYDARMALEVMTVKVIAAGFLFGSPMMFLYSLAGSLLAFVGMYLLSRFKRIPIVVVSMVAAVLHNTGQLGMAALILHTPAVLINIIPLAIAALITGGLTGAIAKIVVDDIPETEVMRSRGGIQRCGSASLSFGSYRPGTAPLYRLDARIKIIACLVFFVLAFCLHGLAGYLVLAALTMCILALSGMSVGQALRLLRPFVYLIIFVLAFDSLFLRDGTVLFEGVGLCISTGGILFAIDSVLRFICLVLALGALMRTTSADELSFATRRLLSPLRHLGLRVEDAALAVEVSMRFIPLLTEEFYALKQSQESRGAQFSSGSPLARARSFLPVFVPLFVSAIARANALAVAICARAYGAKFP